MSGTPKTRNPSIANKNQARMASLTDSHWKTTPRIERGDFYRARNFGLGGPTSRSRPAQRTRALSEPARVLSSGSDTRFERLVAHVSKMFGW
jgi:hypothetical protein